MKQTKIIMGMPVTVEIAENCTSSDLKTIFDYFNYIDNTFSTYKKDSEISKINRGELRENDYSPDVREVFRLSEKTKRETNGYFDIWQGGNCDPSGLVKGWAIEKASRLLKKKGFKNFYVNAGGDVTVSGQKSGRKWRVGIKNPFKQDEVVKVVCLTNQAAATSGTYIRGQHIYNPQNDSKQKDVVSLTVIGSTIYDADRFATAAFAMGRQGIFFLEEKKGLEGYMIDRQGRATFTTGFEKFVC